MKNISFKSLRLPPFVKKFYSQYSRHAAFGAVIIVLLVYVMVVLKINSLANAEPSATLPTANNI
jgi:ABC-type sulfate transport system permease subunit